MLALTPDEPATASVLEVAAEVARRGAPVVTIGPAAVSGLDAVPVLLPPQARVAPWLTPLPVVVPAQLLAQRVAEARGSTWTARAASRRSPGRPDRGNTGCATLVVQTSAR